jgi:hypothetical protein
VLMTATVWAGWRLLKHVSSQTAEDYQRLLPDLRPIPDRCSPRRHFVFHWDFNAELVVHHLAWAMPQLSCIP